MRGALNKTGLEKIDGDWKVVDMDRIYPKILRMPSAGIKRARNIVHNKNDDTNPG
ncbi:hypothetical protein GF380_02105 [Candidatus Uhrbacteria bacterium]|nr:hypothetical protein [Candidatus Uhrbacteria bacterium]